MHTFFLFLIIVVIYGEKKTKNIYAKNTKYKHEFAKLF
jgi:hypothetical protein